MWQVSYGTTSIFFKGRNFFLDKQLTDKYEYYALYNHITLCVSYKLQNRSRYFINSLEKGMTILDIFAKHSIPLGLTDVARLSNMNLVSATRYLRTLTELGYIVLDSSNKKYSPAPKIMSLGLSFVNNMDLRSRVHLQLVSVSKEFDVTTSCSILDGIEIVYVERIKGGDTVHLDLGTGSRLPAFASAMGRAMLAHLPPETLLELVNEMEFKSHTPYTIIDKEIFLAELKRTRQRGYGQNFQELKLGYANLGAPIYKEGRVEAAFGVTFAHNKIKDNRFRKAITARLIDAAKQTSIA